MPEVTQLTRPSSEHQVVHSVAQSCPTLCDPIDCSTPGFPEPQVTESKAAVFLSLPGVLLTGTERQLMWVC